MKIEKAGNDSLSNEYKKEIQVIFHKSMDLLTNIILNNRNNNNSFSTVRSKKATKKLIIIIIIIF